MTTNGASVGNAVLGVPTAEGGSVCLSGTELAHRTRRNAGDGVPYASFAGIAPGGKKQIQDREVYRMYYIGIDLGTSSTKMLLLDERGTIHAEVAHDYPL